MQTCPDEPGQDRHYLNRNAARRTWLRLLTDHRIEARFVSGWSKVPAANHLIRMEADAHQDFLFLNIIVSSVQVDKIVSVVTITPRVHAGGLYNANT